MAQSDTVTLTLQVGDLQLSREVPARTAKAAARRLLKQAQELRKEFPAELCVNVETVPGGSIPFTWGDEWESRRIGFRTTNQPTT